VERECRVSADAGYLDFRLKIRFWEYCNANFWLLDRYRMAYSLFSSVDVMLLTLSISLPDTMQ
jgi:hypothetical protein